MFSHPVPDDESPDDRSPDPQAPGAGLSVTRFWLAVSAVGLVGGAVGAAYVEVMRTLGNLLGPTHWARPAHLLLLGAVGAAIGLLTLVLGNPGDVELLVDNIHVQGGPRDLRQLPSLIPISLLGIAAGSAIGPEAPLTQTTGSLGSWIGRRARATVAESRALAITGMAAGFTVLFGAPLGSAIFALEILHRRGTQYYEALLPAAAGSCIGYAVYVVVTHLGLTPIWRFPVVPSLKPVDLAVGLLAGVAGAGVAFTFTSLTAGFRRVFGWLPVGLRPVAGGLFLGGLAWLSPYALTFGEGQIQTIADGRLLVSTLLVAALAKILASSSITSAGWRGGVIIPLFFIGAAVGAAGAPALHVAPAIAILAMMVATNVGVTKTPFGSCLIVVEMAGTRMIPPVLVASLISLLLTSRLPHARRPEDVRDRLGPEGVPGVVGVIPVGGEVAAGRQVELRPCAGGDVDIDGARPGRREGTDIRVEAPPPPPGDRPQRLMEAQRRGHVRDAEHHHVPHPGGEPGQQHGIVPAEGPAVGQVRDVVGPHADEHGVRAMVAGPGELVPDDVGDPIARVGEGTQDDGLTEEVGELLGQDRLPPGGPEA